VLLVEAIRTFARNQIGLDTATNYTCIFDTGGQPVGWNVSACPTDRFEPYLWSFPIVGQLPYKGFFDRKMAEAERDALIELGLDVIMRPLSAFSTLGYFSDPILSPMLEYPPERLAELLFHELTHGTVYVSGHTDFNESLATFVGQTAGERFLSFQYGEKTPLIDAARLKRSDRARFQAFLTEVVTELDSLYQLHSTLAQTMLERDLIFANAKDRFRSMRHEFELLTFDEFLAWEMNNARMMSFRRYNRDLGEFQDLYDRVGRRFDFFIDALKPCEVAEDPWRCLRDAPADAVGTG
jgi:predicted aminopeptidase